MLGDDGQDPFRLGLASQLDVEIARLELQQPGQQSGVVDVQAVRRILIAARAGVHSDATSLGVAETLENLVIERDEVVQDASAGVELEGEPSFGEVKLDDVRASLQRVPDVGRG